MCSITYLKAAGKSYYPISVNEYSQYFSCPFAFTSGSRYLCAREYVLPRELLIQRSKPASARQYAIECSVPLQQIADEAEHSPGWKKITGRYSDPPLVVPFGPQILCIVLIYPSSVVYV